MRRNAPSIAQPAGTALRPPDDAGAQARDRAQRARRAAWVARHKRRAAFIAAERLSRAEAIHLPLDFDPAD